MPRTCRRPVIEALEPRVVPANNIVMDPVTANGFTTLTVRYFIDGAIPNFDIGVYRSLDTVRDASDVLVSTLSITDPADRTPQSHAKSLTIGTDIELPGVGNAAETDEDYYLLVQADPSNAVVEAHENDNTAAMTGTYHVAGGAVYFQGAPDTDSIAFATNGANLLADINGDALNYSTADVTSFRLRMHGGIDNVYGTTGEGPPLALAMRAWGGTGNDIIVGGTADDIVSGGLGNDKLDGALGSDTITEVGLDTSKLSDVKLTGVGTDTLTSFEKGVLTGTTANNNLDAAGFSGPVTLDGGAGKDVLKGGPSADVLLGGPGDDTLGFGPGDQLDGGDDSDLLTAAGAGTFTLADASLDIAGSAATLTAIERASLTGGTGADIFEVSGWTGPATLNGGAGTDKVVQVALADHLLTNTSLTRTLGAVSNTFKLSSIDTADLSLPMGGSPMRFVDASAFSRGPVHLRAGSSYAIMTGGTKNDVLDSFHGVSTVLIGGPGDDSFIGDTFNGGVLHDKVAVSGNNFMLTDTSIVGEGNDTLTGVFLWIAVNGGSGNNKIDASAVTSTQIVMNGNAGNDTLIGGGGNDNMNGGPGNDKLDGRGGIDIVIADADVNYTLSDTKLVGQGTDTLINMEQADLTGGNHNNKIDASAWSGATLLIGSGGNDTLIGGSGLDQILGNDGDDSLVGNNGIDQLYGGKGNDTLSGGEGDDTLYGDAGTDKLDGGNGTDTGKDGETLISIEVVL